MRREWICILSQHNHIERIMLLTKEEEEDLPELWTNKEFLITKTPSKVPTPRIKWTEDGKLPFKPIKEEPAQTAEAKEDVPPREEYEEVPETALQEFEKRRWLDSNDTAYEKGKHHQALLSDTSSFSESSPDIQATETPFISLADYELANYKEAMKSDNTAKWMKAPESKYTTVSLLKSLLDAWSPTLELLSPRWSNWSEGCWLQLMCCTLPKHLCP